MKGEAPILLRRTRHGLEALDAVDAEALDVFAFGETVEVTFRKRRSGPQHRLYWKVLGNVVKATDKWPTAKKLHRELKFALGYVEKSINGFNGAVTYEVDSTAFEKMDGTDFKIFFDRAMKLIAETCGFDPLATYEEMKCDKSPHSAIDYLSAG